MQKSIEKFLAKKQMKARVFIDTNIFFYFFSDTDLEKKEISSQIIKSSFKSDNFFISYQVIQEFSNVLLTKARPPMKEQDVSSLIEKILEPMCSFFPTVDFYKRALKLREKNQLSYYDSLIALAALELNCEYLLSEDFHDGARIHKMKVVNPFRKTNQKVINTIL